MDVVGDLLTRDRRSRDPALVTATGSERSYHDLITNGYKSANVLRYLGAREGSTVAIDPIPGFHTVLAFLGAARLGTRVRFDPDRGLDAGDRVVMVPVADEGTTAPRPGTKLITYGGSPERPETTHWEQELWSENPGTPPANVDPSDPLLVHDRDDPERRAEATHSHAAVLATARRIVAEHDLATDSRVVIRTSLGDPGTVAAGLVAPLSVGGTVVLSRRDVNGGDATDREGVDREPRGDLAIVEDPDAGDPARVPEPQRIGPPAVSE